MKINQGYYERDQKTIVASQIKQPLSGACQLGCSTPTILGQKNRNIFYNRNCSNVTSFLSSSSISPSVSFFLFFHELPLSRPKVEAEEVCKKSYNVQAIVSILMKGQLKSYCLHIHLSILLQLKQAPRAAYLKSVKQDSPFL